MTTHRQQVLGGRPFLNYTQSVKTQFDSNQGGSITRADTNRSGLVDKCGKGRPKIPRKPGGIRTTGAASLHPVRTAA